MYPAHDRQMLHHHHHASCVPPDVPAGAPPSGACAHQSRPLAPAPRHRGHRGRDGGALPAGVANRVGRAAVPRASPSGPQRGRDTSALSRAPSPWHALCGRSDWSKHQSAGRSRQRFRQQRDTQPRLPPSHAFDGRSFDFLFPGLASEACFSFRRPAPFGNTYRACLCRYFR